MQVFRQCLGKKTGIYVSLSFHGSEEFCYGNTEETCEASECFRRYPFFTVFDIIYEGDSHTKLCRKLELRQAFLLPGHNIINPV